MIHIAMFLFLHAGAINEMENFKFVPCIFLVIVGLLSLQELSTNAALACCAARVIARWSKYLTVSGCLPSDWSLGCNEPDFEASAPMLPGLAELHTCVPHGGAGDVSDILSVSFETLVLSYLFSLLLLLAGMTFVTLFSWESSD